MRQEQYGEEAQDVRRIREEKMILLFGMKLYAT